jgi:bile acid:Na+ symporter, BASS family
MPEDSEQQRSGSRRVLFVLSLAALAAAAVGWAVSAYTVMGSAAVLACVLLAFYFQGHPTLKTFTFTFWVFAFFFAALVYPAPFLSWGDFQLTRLIVPLIQIIMFGMGASLSIGDFARALKMPRAVLVGMALQFTVMPLVGWAIATSFGFEPEIAAGIILIGSCSGGVASNVMTFLARGNVALSVTMTACSTMMAPFVTPFAMKLLAGRLIEIQVVAMMMSIVNLIILPIVAGLVTNKLLHSRIRGQVWRPIAVLLGVGFLALAPAVPVVQTQLLSLGAACLLMACLRRHWLEAGLPIVSMAAICYILAIIAASTRAQILQVGVSLFAAAIAHNTMGYLLGYWGARAGGISESDCRTVAFEVGMQNGGMGTALALDVLKSASAAIGPAIFGTWMNISGSVLASWWRDRIPEERG